VACLYLPFHQLYHRPDNLSSPDLSELPGQPEVRLQEFEGVGHVGPAEADADVVWLVVDRPREEQDAGLGEPSGSSSSSSAIVRDWQSLLESMNRVLCSYRA
jgi:hypothetical protein